MGVEGAPVCKSDRKQIFSVFRQRCAAAGFEYKPNSDSEDQGLFQKNEYFEFNPLLNKDIPRSFSDIDDQQSSLDHW